MGKKGKKCSKVIRSLGQLSRNIKVQIPDLTLKEAVFELLPLTSRVNSTIIFNGYAGLAYSLISTVTV